ncbi:cytochrome P450 71D13-like [Andrographis paniculata]|uniref:cytochrome P450 71D13-like n=1 Tax=Andrographis paniculata TaxID=175694 RepID=UPI0021E71673|nr:cytochrome P450 71D13-like [Andrographis paniculata]
MATTIDILFLLPPLTILLLTIITFTFPHRSQITKLPPTPPRLPLIGHIPHLAGKLPHRALAGLARKYGPILHLHLGQVPAVLISSPPLAGELLKVQDPACADRPDSIGIRILCYNNSDIVSSPYGGYWRQMRKICIIEMLSSKNVRSFCRIREDEVARFVESIFASSAAGESPAVDVSDRIFRLTSSVVSRVAFGRAVGGRDELLGMIDTALTMAVGLELPDIFPALSAAARVLSWNERRLRRLQGKIDGVLDGILEEHRRRRSGEFGGEDIVDVLVRVKDSGDLQFPITDDHIKAVILDMFSGGTDTSSTTIDWAMAELMRNPSAMAKAQVEVREAFKGKKTIQESDIIGLKYLKLIIKETLRLHPPVPIIFRATRNECVVDEYIIPEKYKVLINVWSIGRDPAYWQHPEAFQPERFENSSIDFFGNNFEFVPFGSGRRMCPGINFGLANIEFPLAQLLFHFDWKMPDGKTPDDIDMTEGNGIVVSRKNGLFLIPTPYNSS